MSEAERAAEAAATWQNTAKLLERNEVLREGEEKEGLDEWNLVVILVDGRGWSGC